MRLLFSQVGEVRNMRDSIKMMQLDFLTVKKYIKQILLSALFASIIVIPTLPQAVNVIIFVFASYFMMYPFMIAEQNGLDKLYSILPCEPHAMVKAKYLTALVYLVSTVIILIPINGILFSILKEKISLEIVLACAVVGIMMYSLVVSIQLPCCFKFGYAKAKILNMILPLGIGFGVPAIVFLAQKFLNQNDFDLMMESISNIIEYYYLEIGIGCIVCSIVFLVISYLITLKVYKKTSY